MTKTIKGQAIDTDIGKWYSVGYWADDITNNWCVWDNIVERRELAKDPPAFPANWINYYPQTHSTGSNYYITPGVIYPNSGSIITSFGTGSLK